MSLFNFYYDESEHSRAIGYKTVTADNFYDNFISVIIGWKSTDEEEIKKAYQRFEEKYRSRHPDGELKSNTLKNKQLEFGFTSTNNDNSDFILDFFDLFTDKIRIYFSTFSKTGFLINQLFYDYKNSIAFDMDAMKYTITKALVINKPKALAESVFSNPGQVIDDLKLFFIKKIQTNEANKKLKENESLAFRQVLMLLHNIKPIKTITWDYKPPFIGFKLYLQENSIREYSLTIDKEGDDQKTVNAAKEAGLKYVYDIDSTEHFGIRMADMLAGLIGKLMKKLCSQLHPSNPDSLQKTLLPNDWYNVNEKQLTLYKKMYHIICELNNSWYKSYAGAYADDMISLVALLGFMNHFSSSDEIKKDITMQGEYYNAYTCESLSAYYSRLHCKLPIDPISKSDTEKDFFLNQRGAKVFFDTNKQPMLPIKDGESKYRVLSVSFDKKMISLITIEEKNEALCYRLPRQLTDWAVNAVALANMGGILFPSDVVFTKKNNKYYAGIQ